MNINLTLFGQAIAFAIFVAFCMKFVWPPLINAISERQRRIADGLNAAEKAKADLAKDIATASIFTNNPVYSSYMIALANASAIKDTDKFIFTPEGVFPQLVFGSNGLTPVVPIK